MTRIAPPSEKIIAVAGTYRALVTELEGLVETKSATVQASLLDAAVAIAMRSDTRDMGLLGKPDSGPWPKPDDRCDDCGMPFGAHDPSVEH